MFNIRRSLFETNSSSTHSISLSKPQPNIRDDIPTNTKIYLNPYDEPACGYDDESVEIVVYRTQMAKLRYLTHIIVSILQEDVPEKYMTEFKGKIDNWQYKQTIEEKEEYGKRFFELPQFIWLCELVYDKTKSNLYIQYDTNNMFPFWETVYDDEESLLNIFEFNEDSWNNETKFKSKMSHFIFDDNVVIYDKNIPYSADFTSIKEL